MLGRMAESATSTSSEIESGESSRGDTKTIEPESFEILFEFKNCRRALQVSKQNLVIRVEAKLWEKMPR